MPKYGKRFYKHVKKAVLSISESKHLNYSYGKIELYHNSPYTFKLNDANYLPTQGNADYQRVGDQIHMGGFMLRMAIGQKSDRPNVRWRWGIIKLPKGSTSNYSVLFDQVTNNAMLDPWNTDAVKVIKTGWWQMQLTSLEVGETAKEQTHFKKLWVSYKRLLKFQPLTGNNTHDDGDLYFMVVPYDTYGTLTSDNICWIQITQTLYYKDP